jgi:hypothetical protein
MHEKKKKTTWWPLGDLIVKKKTFPSRFQKKNPLNGCQVFST